MNSIIVGLISISFGLWGLTVWWWSFAELLRGLTPLVLVLIGLLALAAGIAQIQQSARKPGKAAIDDDL